MSTDHDQITEAIERLSARRFSKDIGLADEFETDAVVAGSELRELHFGAAEVHEHFATNMGKPHTVRWVWDRLHIDVAGDAAWFFAHGNAMVGRDGSEAPYPFRMSGVFAKRDGQWRWKHLHASEPAS